ncbi:sperm-associated antigen 16 protein-like [Melanotaenia boesemani]|uniref:sperm-associated antigen 16 protein-like n=1 Tax=Melanotaenia boesemani TaxID=1250792 RepID=UPI001C041D0D|nr:sperm-associated antigen 16 protein-like [Melanotaenia boesemani]
MNAANKNQDKHGEDLPSDIFYEFRNDEVPFEDGWSLTEGEEDFEATVKAIQARAEARARANQSSSANASTHPPPSVAQFLRHFLWEMGMKETLDCFQNEWAEMVQKGLVDEEWVDVVPDVYIENQRLDKELKNARREREEYRQATSVAAETLVQVKRTRDIHRMRHKRVVQEKSRVIEEIRKLKQQCESHESALKRMNEKYQAVLKQVMLVAMQTDKSLLEVNSQSDQQGTLVYGGEAMNKSVRETAHPVTQPRPPAHRGCPGRQLRVQPVKESKCSLK